MNFQRIQEAVKVIQRTTKRYLALKRLQEECNIKLKSDTSVEEFFNESLPHKNPALNDNAPLNFPTSPVLRCFSSSKTTPRQFEFISSLASRAGGSWFDPLETRPNQFTPQNIVLALCSRQISINFARGHVSPVAMLMCNFSSPKPQVDDKNKTSARMLRVNKSSAIISRRDIEKVTYLCESFFVRSRQSLGFSLDIIPSLSSFPLGEIGWGVLQVCNWSLLVNPSSEQLCNHVKQLCLS